MQILEIDTGDRRQVRRFLDLPFAVYRHIPQWVPPLAIEARRPLDRPRNPFFRHSEAAFFLALEENGETLGRLAVLNHRPYNEFNRERSAFFALFECVDRPAASEGLFEAAFEWSRARGLERMIGPRGFTPFDGLGLLVDGFQHRPAFGIPYNPPYYPALVEAAGFHAQGDLVSGYLARGTPFPEAIHRLAARVRRRRGLRVARYRSRRDLRRLVPRLRELYNAALEGTSGNVPLDEGEARALAGQLLWFADPRLIKIVMKDDRPVGFLFAYPDVSAALQRTRGRLFPFGWLDLLLELRRTRWVNVNGMAIVEEYRGLGGTALLFSEMAKTLLEEGRTTLRPHFDHADLVQIGVDNHAMMRETRDLGVDFYKRHRVYERAL